MNARQLILLSPYRLPTESSLYVGDEEVAAILEGLLTLWHPAALSIGTGLPRLALPYDHDEPSGECLYGMPDNPPLMLPDDWLDRARSAGAIVFTSTPDRATTQANLFAALREAFPDDQRLAHLMALPAERVRPFQGIGFGYAVLEALFEAMSHDNVLPTEEVFQDLTAALAALDDPDAHRLQLQSAADRLLSAREVVYPVTLYLVDLFLLDPQAPATGWPAALSSGQPLNVIASASLLERLSREHPESFATLREKVGAEQVEVLGGGHGEREDPLLPIESQLWNLLKGQALYQQLLDREVRVFARRRSGFHAQLPLFLQSAGIGTALMVSFDDGMIPGQHTIVVSWPSHDGKQVEAFTRAGQPADTPQTYFHLAHHLHQTIMQDQSATMVLLHKGKPAPPWYEDWLALTSFAPVLGRWTTLSSYFGEVVSGDYVPSIAPDEFQTDYLTERTASLDELALAEGGSPAPWSSTVPISGFADQVRGRRRLDAAWTFASILRSLGGQVPEIEGQAYLTHLAQVEDRFESGGTGSSLATAEVMQRSAEALARRLVARGPANNPGHLVLNPCSFTRRVALELHGITSPIAVTGPVKACQIDGDVARLVVEVPPLGFAWIGHEASSGQPAASAARMKLADERAVRNEFFEAEIDPQTGGLRGIRDQRMRIGRLGQQLVYNPGSTMRARSVVVHSTGPALGEVTSEGDILDEQEQVVATFRQRFRAWLGRPMLDLRIELEPVAPVQGYPWHAYFGARFAWRDEMATLLRGSVGMRTVTSQNRPESPDFLELRVGRQNVVLFPGGLPFHQRHGSRMLDVLLVCERESSRVFELGIGVDREQPMQTALGVASPVAVVPCNQGPPHVGATGWLYHLDASNLLLTSLRPVTEHADALVATMLECAGAGGPAQFRCVRNPVRAIVQDVRGNALIDAPVQGDAVELEVSANDLLQLRVEFS